MKKWKKITEKNDVFSFFFFVCFVFVSSRLQWNHYRKRSHKKKRKLGNNFAWCNKQSIDGKILNFIEIVPLSVWNNNNFVENIFFVSNFSDVNDTLIKFVFFFFLSLILEMEIQKENKKQMPIKNHHHNINLVTIKHGK